MAHIIPRWEWRMFGESFGDADQRFKLLAPRDVEESDEVYLLSPTVDENVKIRNQLMDIKALQQVNADGLEQWKPVMKGSFPLSSADVGKVFGALHVTTPPLARASYTEEQLIDELVKPAGQVRTVTVHKKRARYRIDDCAAEMTEVAANGKNVRTVAVESEDPFAVIAAVRGLGLGRFENVSYPRGLKRLVGMAR
jgi:exopolyphosphatase / guanosine-5'-triphosphate,3'-diphosphate pyrophosphatase